MQSLEPPSMPLSHHCQRERRLLELWQRHLELRLAARQLELRPLEPRLVDLRHREL